MQHDATDKFVVTVQALSRYLSQFKSGEQQDPVDRVARRALELQHLATQNFDRLKDDNPAEAQKCQVVIIATNGVFALINDERRYHRAEHVLIPNPNCLVARRSSADGSGAMFLYETVEELALYSARILTGCEVVLFKMPRPSDSTVVPFIWGRNRIIASSDLSVPGESVQSAIVAFASLADRIRQNPEADRR